ncbi:hypothetical protein JZ751_004727 [Albula glossodonta]|uniref:Immunoglobulin domain-containing protein n=1 Tax=Albula glossodonta TaxID=121402 RepID=A0A8T2N640_9TELE|nr:hypothetical protein JZ751_004727 [Albula glossodonta]
MRAEDCLSVLAAAMAILPGVLSSNWNVLLPPGPIHAVPGSSMVIPCWYSYPEIGGRYRVRSVMWCRNQAYCITPSYVYHSDGIFLEPEYRGRVEYLGDTSNNCTLKIADLRVSDSGTYVFRFITDHPVEKLPGQRGITLMVSDKKREGDRAPLLWIVVVILVACALVAAIVWMRKKRGTPGERQGGEDTLAL